MSTEAQQLGVKQSERNRQQSVAEHHAHHGDSGPTHVVAGGAATAAAAHYHPQQSVFSRAGHFVLHFVEMCLAMCIGGIILNVLFFMGAAQIGYPDLVERYPEFSVLMIGILLAIPMAAWMRYRGHEWRPNLEMSITTIILAILLIGAAWLGIIPRSGMLEWMLRLACPVMLIPMLFRLDLYTGHHAGHSGYALPKRA